MLLNRHMKSGLTALGGRQAVRLGFEMYTCTQTTAVRVCLQYSFSLTLKTTIHKTLILMRSLGAELEEELMTGWGIGGSLHYHLHQDLPLERWMWIGKKKLLLLCCWWKCREQLWPLCFRLIFLIFLLERN